MVNCLGHLLGWDLHHPNHSLHHFHQKGLLELSLDPLVDECIAGSDPSDQSDQVAVDRDVEGFGRVAQNSNIGLVENRQNKQE